MPRSIVVRLPASDDLFFDLFLYFGNDFFDACRMDAAVRYQLVQRQTRDFTAYRIEARQDDRFRRVVDDDLDAGSGFQGPDVPSFAADDPAFHFVALDVEHRDRVFDGRFGSDALDRLYDDLFRFLVGAHLGLFHHFVDIGHRFGLGLLFHVFDQDVLGFVATEAADLFETGVLFLDFAVEVFLLAFDALDLSLQTLWRTESYSRIFLFSSSCCWVRLFSSCLARCSLWESIFGCAR